MADRICWRCGTFEDWTSTGQGTHSCNSCGAAERDVRCRKCMVPSFIPASERQFRCHFCGKESFVHPGDISGHRKPFPGAWPEPAASVEAPPRAAASDGESSSRSVTTIARELMRLQREQPVAWDFGKTAARIALDSRSPTLVKYIHDNGEEGEQFYAEELSLAIPPALREAVAAGELDVPTPIAPDAEEAARLAAYSSTLEWLQAEPR